MSIPTQPTSPLISQSLSPPTCRKTDQSSEQQTDVKVASRTKSSTPKKQVYAISGQLVQFLSYLENAHVNTKPALESCKET